VTPGDRVAIERVRAELGAMTLDLRAGATANAQRRICAVLQTLNAMMDLPLERLQPSQPDQLEPAG
jgi:hypothetical protein